MEANPYELLGLDSSATAAEIQAAFKKKMLEVHPGKGGTPKIWLKLSKTRIEALEKLEQNN